jgi:hypothetical protein
MQNVNAKCITMLVGVHSIGNGHEYSTSVRLCHGVVRGTVNGLPSFHVMTTHLQLITHPCLVCLSTNFWIYCLLIWLAMIWSWKIQEENISSHYVAVAGLGRILWNVVCCRQDSPWILIIVYTGAHLWNTLIIKPNKLLI